MNQVVNGCMMCVMKYGGQVKARKNCRYFHSSINEGMYVPLDEKEKSLLATKSYLAENDY